MSIYPDINQYLNAVENNSFDKLKGIQTIKDKDANTVYIKTNKSLIVPVFYNNKKYALKCFLEDVLDRKERYYEIIKHLNYLKSDYFVFADFCIDEIKISEINEPLSVLLIEWIEGKTLGEFINETIKTQDEKQQKSILEDLYSEFVKLAMFLLDSGIAHGDLSHTNIMITEDKQIKLIDYDGMFVPELNGLIANEIGTVNFQHPKRDYDMFDHSIDNFSILNIATSILALSLNPKLYQEFNFKKNILFIENDFLKPDKSKLIQQLHSIQNYNMHKLLNSLLAFIVTNKTYSPVITSLLLDIANTEQATQNSIVNIKHTPPVKIIQSKENIIINGIELIWVEGGTFTMGATEEQGDGCLENEKPAHQVSLDGFYIGKYPVTKKQWREVTGFNSSYFKNSDDCPVEQVSWNDAQMFLEKLNENTGKTFKLPTEAEWEFAARGGNKSQNYRYSGSDDIDQVAWHYQNSDNKVQPVGLKMPNELGIFDMSGNVWEWCNDWYGNYSHDMHINPIGNVQGLGRVYRGGSWYSNSKICRIAFRGYFTPYYKYSKDIGFRIVLKAD